MTDIREYKSVQLLKVVDGDTFDFMVDVGFDVHVKIRTRLLNYNAPEMKTPQGLPAKQIVEELFSTGRHLVINTIKDKKCKYGRYLVIVYIDGIDLLTLIKERSAK